MKNKIIAALLTGVVTLGSLFYAVPREEAKAAIAFLYDKNNPNTMLTLSKVKEVFLGQSDLDIDYSIGGRTSGVSGTWKSSNKAVAAVSKDGVVKALKSGSTVISFGYMVNGKLQQIKCRVKVSDGIDSLEIAGTGNFSGSMPADSIIRLKATAKSGGNIVEVGPGKKTAYGTFFEIFLDEECKNPAPSSLATVTSSGFLVSGSETGKLYIRAVVKGSKDAKNGIFSNVLTVDVKNRMSVTQTGTNTFTVESGNKGEITGITVKNLKGEQIASSFTLSADKKTATVTAFKELTETCNVEITAGTTKYNITARFEAAVVKEIAVESSEAPLTTLNNSGMTAEINYKLLDQFGNDVTRDIRFSGKTYALWGNTTRVAAAADGKFLIPLSAEQTVGYTGTLEIVYGGVGNISKSISVKIGNPSYIKSVEVMGIYKRTRDGYAKVMDSSTFLSKGTVIGNFGGNSQLNTLFDSYYVLVRVKDSYGNSISSAGIDQTKIALSITGGTGLEQDRADGKLQSITPVNIGGESFLTYPLKAATLNSGLVSIRAVTSGNTANHTMDSRVTEGVNAGTLVLAGEGKVGVENLITFILYNAANVQLMKYEEVIAALGLNDYGSGQAVIMPGSNTVSAANGSYFIVKKNKTTGFAEMYYVPSYAALPAGMVQNGEEITVFKGTVFEKKYVLTVKSK